ncbi:prolipoprotein diacylglyceryl transferase [Patescibacteria group bacterium]|nr:prolipoprotein diacylglyceryl transferase [Patescibacteria group bacterium]
MYPLAFTIGTIHIYAAGIFLILSWFVFSFLFWKYLRSVAVDEQKIFDITFYGTIMGLITGRAGFVFLHPQLFLHEPLRIVALWVQPGFSFLFGLIGFVVFSLIGAQRRKIRAGHMLDAVAFALPLSYCVGAFGSLLVGSEVGLPTKFPVAIEYVGHPYRRHPVQLYQIVLSLVILLVVLWISRRAGKKSWPYGLVGVLFFLLFSAGLFLIEFLRADAIYWYRISANQWILVGIFAQSLGAFYVRGGGKEAVHRLIIRIHRRVRNIPDMLYGTIHRQKT